MARRKKTLYTTRESSGQLSLLGAIAQVKSEDKLDLRERLQNISTQQTLLQKPQKDIVDKRSRAEIILEDMMSRGYFNDNSFSSSLRISEDIDLSKDKIVTFDGTIYLLNRVNMRGGKSEFPYVFCIRNDGVTYAHEIGFGRTFRDEAEKHVQNLIKSKREEEESIVQIPDLDIGKSAPEGTILENFRDYTIVRQNGRWHKVRQLGFHNESRVGLSDEANEAAERIWAYRLAKQEVVQYIQDNDLRSPDERRLAFINNLIKSHYAVDETGDIWHVGKNGGGGLVKIINLYKHNQGDQYKTKIISSNDELLAEATALANRLYGVNSEIQESIIQNTNTHSYEFESVADIYEADSWWQNELREYGQYRGIDSRNNRHLRYFINSLRMKGQASDSNNNTTYISSSNNGEWNLGVQIGEDSDIVNYHVSTSSIKKDYDFLCESQVVLQALSLADIPNSHDFYIFLKERYPELCKNIVERNNVLGDDPAKGKSKNPERIAFIERLRRTGPERSRAVVNGIRYNIDQSGDWFTVFADDEPAFGPGKSSFRSHEEAITTLADFVFPSVSQASVWAREKGVILSHDNWAGNVKEGPLGIKTIDRTAMYVMGGAYRNITVERFKKAWIQERPTGGPFKSGIIDAESSDPKEQKRISDFKNEFARVLVENGLVFDAGNRKFECLYNEEGEYWTITTVVSAGSINSGNWNNPIDVYISFPTKEDCLKGAAEMIAAPPYVKLDEIIDRMYDGFYIGNDYYRIEIGGILVSQKPGKESTRTKLTFSSEEYTRHDVAASLQEIIESEHPELRANSPSVSQTSQQLPPQKQPATNSSIQPVVVTSLREMIERDRQRKLRANRTKVGDSQGLDGTRTEAQAAPEPQFDTFKYRNWSDSEWAAHTPANEGERILKEFHLRGRDVDGNVFLPVSLGVRLGREQWGLTITTKDGKRLHDVGASQAWTRAQALAARQALANLGLAGKAFPVASSLYAHGVALDENGDVLELVYENGQYGIAVNNKLPAANEWGGARHVAIEEYEKRRKAGAAEESLDKTAPSQQTEPAQKVDQPAATTEEEAPLAAGTTKGTRQIKSSLRYWSKVADMGMKELQRAKNPVDLFMRQMVGWQAVDADGTIYRVVVGDPERQGSAPPWHLKVLRRGEHEFSTQEYEDSEAWVTNLPNRDRAIWAALLMANLPNKEEYIAKVRAKYTQTQDSKTSQETAITAENIPVSPQENTIITSNETNNIRSEFDWYLKTGVWEPPKDSETAKRIDKFFEILESQETSIEIISEFVNEVSSFARENTHRDINEKERFFRFRNYLSHLIYNKKKLQASQESDVKLTSDSYFQENFASTPLGRNPRIINIINNIHKGITSNKKLVESVIKYETDLSLTQEEYDEFVKNQKLYHHFLYKTSEPRKIFDQLLAQAIDDISKEENFPELLEKFTEKNRQGLFSSFHNWLSVNTFDLVYKRIRLENQRQIALAIQEEDEITARQQENKSSVDTGVHQGNQQEQNTRNEFIDALKTFVPVKGSDNTTYQISKNSNGTYLATVDKQLATGIHDRSSTFYANIDEAINSLADLAFPLSVQAQNEEFSQSETNFSQKKDAREEKKQYSDLSQSSTHIPELPLLTGSPRQVKWAVDIRKKAAQVLVNKFIETSPVGFPAETIAYQAIALETNAAWWIQNRSKLNDASSILKSLSKTHKIEIDKLRYESRKIRVNSTDNPSENLNHNQNYEKSEEGIKTGSLPFPENQVFINKKLSEKIANDFKNLFGNEEWARNPRTIDIVSRIIPNRALNDSVFINTVHDSGNSFASRLTYENIANNAILGQLGQHPTDEIFSTYKPFADNEDFISWINSRIFDLIYEEIREDEVTQNLERKEDSAPETADLTNHPTTDTLVEAEQVAEHTNHSEQEKNHDDNRPVHGRPLRQDSAPVENLGPGTLEGVHAESVQDAARDGRADSGGDGSGGEDGARNPGTDGTRISVPRSGGDGAREVRAAAGRARSDDQDGESRSVEPEAKPAFQPAESAVSPSLAPATGQENIPAQNFVITDDLGLGSGGPVQKYNDNIAAITILKRVQAENRNATSEEQRVLARYVGWGGLPEAFRNTTDGTTREGWEERVRRLEALLTPEELQAARSSTQNAHYTSQDVVKAIWHGMQRLGFQGGNVLEPSVGVGNFLGLMPQELAANTRFVAAELDSITAGIARLLYPNERIEHTPFERMPLPSKSFDAMVGNPPFGKTRLAFPNMPAINGFTIHNQFALGCLDAIKPGGIQAFVVSRYLLDQQDSTVRKMIADQAKLLGAFRLPGTAFAENARTEVVTDIIFLQRFTEQELSAREEYKRTLGTHVAPDYPEWVDTTQITDDSGNEPMHINNLFANHPEYVLGEINRQGSMWRNNDIGVTYTGNDFSGDLFGMIDNFLPENVVNKHDAEVSNNIFSYLTENIALSRSGRQEGTVYINKNNELVQVITKLTEAGEYVLTQRIITPDSPWSSDLTLDYDGRWFEMIDKQDEHGKPVKAVNEITGATLKRNQKERRYYTDAEVPSGKRLGEKKYERLMEAVRLLEMTEQQIQMESDPVDADEAVEANRRRLNAAYDRYTKKHGLLNDRKTRALLDDLPNGSLLMALENNYKRGVKKAPSVADKADILLRRVNFPYVESNEKQADTAADALAICLSERGRVDLDRMATLWGQDKNAVVSALFDETERPLIFLDPETQNWVHADEYLTGNVRRKLNAAIAARDAALAGGNEQEIARREKSVAALQAVQPARWESDKVTVIPGATWVPLDVYQDFYEHLTGGGRAELEFCKTTNEFGVRETSSGPKAMLWRTEDRTTSELFAAMLNSRTVRVTRTEHGIDGSQHSVTDYAASAEANDKITEIKEEFADWVFKDYDRRERLVTIFNDKYNVRVTRQYDGTHLRTPGKVPDSVIELRRHQKNAAWRGITDRFVLFDHAVGAGKTFTGIVRAMERKRMGLSNKPMIVVPNHLIKQFAADAHRLYPGAKILEAGPADFERSKRRRMFAKIATNDWDLIIVPHSSFGFIGLDPATEARYIEEDLQSAREELEGMIGKENTVEKTSKTQKKSPTVKSIEAYIDRCRTRLEKIQSKTRDKDKLLTFEQMGVDDITIDEFDQLGKNLGYLTHTQVAGMNPPAGSAKAYDLSTKVRYLRENGGSVAFMTGTPISNSPVEMYTLMRYLAADELKELGLEHFDAWRALYGEISVAFEPTESGSGLKEVARLRDFRNVRSLMDLYYSFADCVSNEDILQWYMEDYGKEFPLPKVEGDGRQAITVKPTEMQQKILQEIIDGFNSLSDITDYKERNGERLRLMDLARKVSLDARVVSPTLKGEKGGKIDVASEQIFNIYEQFNEQKGTQLVFLDRSVPKAKGDKERLAKYDDALKQYQKAEMSGDEEAIRKAYDKLAKFDAGEMEAIRVAQAGGWNAYQQIKDNLVAMGIPADQVRFVHEANTDAEKEALFDAVRSGDVRVLIGSTQRMGAGTNVQDRLVALHHIDVGWKPSEIEQREGRIIRQGNKFATESTPEHPNPLYIPDFKVKIFVYNTERTIDAKLLALVATKARFIHTVRHYNGEFNIEFDDKSMQDILGLAQMAAEATGDPLQVERVELKADIDRLERQKKNFRRQQFGIEDQIRRMESIIEGTPSILAFYEQYQPIIIQSELNDKAYKDGLSININGNIFTGETRQEAFEFVEKAKNEVDASQGRKKLNITIEGEEFHSAVKADAAIALKLGDSTPFVAELNGQRFVSQAAARRYIGELVNKAVQGQPDELEDVCLGTLHIYGLDFDLSFSTKIDTDEHGLPLKTASFYIEQNVPEQHFKNRIVADASGTFLPAGQLNLNSIIPFFNSLSKSVFIIKKDAEFFRKQLHDAEVGLPLAREELAKEWPKQEEYDTKKSRLAEVEKILHEKALQAEAKKNLESELESGAIISTEDTLVPENLQSIIEGTSIAEQNDNQIEEENLTSYSDSDDEQYYDEYEDVYVEDKIEVRQERIDGKLTQDERNKIFHQIAVEKRIIIDTPEGLDGQITLRHYANTNNRKFELDYELIDSIQFIDSEQNSVTYDWQSRHPGKDALTLEETVDEVILIIEEQLAKQQENSVSHDDSSHHMPIPQVSDFESILRREKKGIDGDGKEYRIQILGNNYQGVVILPNGEERRISSDTQSLEDVISGIIDDANLSGEKQKRNDDKPVRQSHETYEMFEARKSAFLRREVEESRQAGTPQARQVDDGVRLAVAESDGGRSLQREHIADKLGEHIGGSRADMAKRNGARGKADEGLPKWAKAAGYSLRDALDGVGVEICVGKVRTGVVYDTDEEALDKLHDMAARDYFFVAPTRSGNRHDGPFTIAATQTRGRRKGFYLDDIPEFATKPEAELYLAEHLSELMEQRSEQVKQRRTPRQKGFREGDLVTADRTERIGAVRRTGDAAPEDFMSAFGFRGVEFGLWNNQQERQTLLNDSYDALMDLADVLNIPPRALSLNGELALAFGARGRGGNARAHYEPDKAVINLTKTTGKGSLAHEWMHALDYYFGGRGESKGALSEHFRGEPENVRPEVYAAFRRLKGSIFGQNGWTKFYKSARNFRNTSYWANNREMLARAFSAYIEDALAERGEKSDFLSYGSSNDLYGEEWSNKPFPEGEERRSINRAFAEFFGTLKVDNSRGQATLYSVADDAEESEGEKNLGQDIETFCTRVDDIFKAKRAKHDVHMLTQTPIILDMLSESSKTAQKAQEGGIYISAHTFNQAFKSEEEGGHPDMNDPEIFKQLPKALADPLAVFDPVEGGERYFDYLNDGDLVFMVAVKDRKGATIVLPVSLTAEGARTTINLVKTGYGKTYSKGDRKGEPFDQWFWDMATKKNAARYIDERRFKRWLGSKIAGSNLPWSHTNAYGERIFRRSDLVKRKEQNRNRYSLGATAPEQRRAEVRAAVDMVGRLIPGLTVRDTNDLDGDIQKLNGGKVRHLRDERNNIVGAYHVGSKTVLLTPGADAGTVLHEIGWHAMYDWTKTNAPQLHKQMREYAQNAPETVQNWVRQRYGSFTAEGVLDEIGAKLFTDKGRSAFEQAVRDRAGRTWYQRLSGKVRDMWNRFAGAHTADLGAYQGLAPDKAMQRLLADITAGKRFVGVRKHDEEEQATRDMVVRFAKAMGVSMRQLRREYDAVAARYAKELEKGDEGRKAPNGNPSKLDKHLWILVRTPRFKAWFGNWEINLNKRLSIVDVGERIFTGRQSAEKWLYEHIKEVTRTATSTDGMVIRIPENKVTGKAISDKAAGSSNLPEELKNDHYEVLRKLPELIEGSTLASVKPDRNNDVNTLGIYRLVAAVRVGDTDYAVKLTVKEVIAPEGRQSNFYTHELAGVSIEQTKRRGVSTANFDGRHAQLTGSPRIDYTLGDLVEAVNTNDKDSTVENPAIPTAFSQVLDENGEPLVVWHGSRQKFWAFDPEKRGRNTGTEMSKKWFFAGDYATASSYHHPANIREIFSGPYFRFTGEKLEQEVQAVMERGSLHDLFINMKNPLIVDTTGYDWEAHKEKGDALMEYSEQAEKGGHDGIIFLNVPDNGDDKGSKKSTVYAFRDPNQAKSATKNTGAFDPNSDDIRYDLSIEYENNSLNELGMNTHIIESDNQQPEKYVIHLEKIKGKVKNKIGNIGKIFVTLFKNDKKPWDADMKMPFNPVTNQRFSAINSLILKAQNKEDPRWMTSEQAQRISARVPKSAQGIPIFDWRKFGDEPRLITTYVFNAEQIEDMPPFEQNTNCNSTNISNICHNVISKSGVKLIHDTDNGAYYVPKKDELHIRKPEEYSTNEEYFSEVIRELCYRSRYKAGINIHQYPPESSERVEEDLRCHLANMLICYDLKTPYNPTVKVDSDRCIEILEQSSQDDPYKMFRIAADAEKMASYVLGKEQGQSQGQQPSPFERPRPLPVLSPDEEFRQAMRDAGLEPATDVKLLEDGKWHSTPGGRYKVKDEGGTLVCSFHRTGNRADVRRVAYGGNSLTPEAVQMLRVETAQRLAADKKAEAAKSAAVASLTTQCQAPRKRDETEERTRASLTTRPSGLGSQPVAMVAAGMRR